MFDWIKEEIINYEPLHIEEDIVLTIDCEEDISYDIVKSSRGFEVYKYRRDGSGDYEPIKTSLSIEEIHKIYEELECM